VRVASVYNSSLSTLRLTLSEQGFLRSVERGTWVGGTRKMGLKAGRGACAGSAGSESGD